LRSACGGSLGEQPLANAHNNAPAQPKTRRLSERRAEREVLTTVMAVVTPQPVKSSRLLDDSRNSRERLDNSRMAPHIEEAFSGVTQSRPRYAVGDFTIAQ
jgi:hypothetical protein